MRTALLFPGQGAPAAAWREAVSDRLPTMWALAAELVGDDHFDRLGEGTEYDQPAVYCASIAAFEAMHAQERKLVTEKVPIAP